MKEESESEKEKGEIFKKENLKIRRIKKERKQKNIESKEENIDCERRKKEKEAKSKKQNR